MGVEQPRLCRVAAAALEHWPDVGGLGEPWCRRVVRVRAMDMFALEEGHPGNTSGERYANWAMAT